jgi:hypothetical protein
MRRCGIRPRVYEGNKRRLEIIGSRIIGKFIEAGA